jgi:uncharacterized phage-associated protein
MPAPLSKYQIDKLGNTLIFLSNNVGDFSKTKALKLLFLLEENSIKEFGVPFFGLDFKLWQFGPVNEIAYEALNTEDLKFLSSYVKYSDADPAMLEAINEFNDDEFSDNDILLMEEIVRFARHKTAIDIVNFTHANGSLWRNTAIENGVYDLFINKKLPTTDILIDFSKLLEKDEYLKERYLNSVEYINFKTLIHK